jgi:hypothetical protein
MISYSTLNSLLSEFPFMENETITEGKENHPLSEWGIIYIILPNDMIICLKQKASHAFEPF